MKKIMFVLLVAAMSMVNMVSAQVYHVYDGSIFSVMFTCTDDNQIGSLQFSSKGSDGQWKWNNFTVDGYNDFEDTSEGGFIFYCIDGVGKHYAIDYYRDRNKIIVHPCDASHNYTGSTQWDLKRKQ